MIHGLADSLVAYLAERDAQHAQTVNSFLTRLSPREQGLLRDAAVMGYVRGTLHSKGERVPKGDQILAEVIDTCLAFPRLCPAVDAVAQQDDGPGTPAETV